jgi:hypothetical protein
LADSSSALSVALSCGAASADGGVAAGGPAHWVPTCPTKVGVASRSKSAGVGVMIARRQKRIEGTVDLPFGIDDLL